ncbi:Tfp pilus assembly protein FimT/FimU [Laceyella putida]|uniref:Tfp pilus assembly protein FimT/FimU n=1 Tax=Laceyella putida TaxID=110101 RepID=A0ABW2RN26_9BACL
MNTGERGWTLIELTMVILVLGWIFSICYPAFATLGERTERQLFLGVLANELILAQTEAESREAEVTVLIDGPAKRVIVYQGEQKQRALLIPGRYQIVSNYPGNRIVFRETGQVRGGTITLLQGEKLLGKIVVHVASGHPKVELVQ